MKKLIVFILALFSLTFVNAFCGSPIIVEAKYTLKDGTYLEGFTVLNEFLELGQENNAEIDGKIFNRNLYAALTSRFAVREASCESMHEGLGEITIFNKINLIPNVHVPGDESAYSRIPLINVDEIYTFDLIEIEELELVEAIEADFYVNGAEFYVTTKEVLNYLADNKMVNAEIKHIEQTDTYVYLLNFNPYNNSEEIKRLYEMYKKAFLSGDAERVEYATERLERRGIIPYKDYEPGC